MTDNENKKVNIDFVRLKQTLVNFIIPLVCFIVIFLEVAFVIYPSYKSIPNVEAELESKAKLEAQLSDKLRVLNNLSDYRNMVDENSELINSVLVSESLVPELLTQISQIAEESGLEITRLTYSFSGSTAKAAEEGYKTVTVSLGTKGTYEQLTSFFANTEKAARLINVKQFRYSSKVSEGESTLEMNLTLESPYLFVQSTAVTDEPVRLDVTDPEFVSLVNKVKTLKFYRITPKEINVELLEEAEESTESEEISE